MCPKYATLWLSIQNYVQLMWLQALHNFAYTGKLAENCDIIKYIFLVAYRKLIDVTLIDVCGDIHPWLGWGGSTFLCSVKGRAGWGYKHNTTYLHVWVTSLGFPVEVAEVTGASTWAAVQRGCLHTAAISRVTWPPAPPTSSGCPVPLPPAGRAAPGRSATPGAEGRWCAGPPPRLAWPGESPIMLNPVHLFYFYLLIYVTQLNTSL